VRTHHFAAVGDARIRISKLQRGNQQVALPDRQVDLIARLPTLKLGIVLEVAILLRRVGHAAAQFAG